MKSFDNQMYPTVKVSGIIMPHNWDENGKVVQIAVYTDKEAVYLVGQNQKGKALLNYINKRVAVQGEILRGSDVSQVVVRNYFVMAEGANDLTDIK